MRLVFRILFLLNLFPLCGASELWAQQATATQDLYRSPSAKSTVIDHIANGDRLLVVRTKPVSGYYHVKTEQDVIGWALAGGINVGKTPSKTPTPPKQPQLAGHCDDTGWGRVYHNYRLIVHQQCIIVTGAIVDASNGKEPDGVRHEPDGDTHGWLKVDPQFQSLLNAGNTSAEGGNLVFEIICKYSVTQPDAVMACSNYQNKVNLPPVGSHVQIVGVYVQDTFHAQWMEVHPVTSITVQ